MRKLFILLLAVAATAPALAQRSIGSKDSKGGGVVIRKNNALFVGPKLGATFTTMSQPNECDLYDASGMGFSLGVDLNARFGKASRRGEGGTGSFGVNLELKYKQNKVKTIGTDDLSLGYLEIPVSAQFYPFVKSNTLNALYVEAGPDFAFTLSKSPDVLSVPSANVVYRTGDLKGGDVRLFAGVGYTVPGTGLGVNARYYLGTSDLAGNFPCKMNSLEVSLSWMFKIGQF